jgi:hypothetical protein
MSIDEFDKEEFRKDMDKFEEYAFSMIRILNKYGGKNTDKLMSLVYQHRSLSDLNN